MIDYYGCRQKNLQLSKQFAYTDMSTLPQVV